MRFPKKISWLLLASLLACKTTPPPQMAYQGNDSSTESNEYLVPIEEEAKAYRIPEELPPTWLSQKSSYKAEKSKVFQLQHTQLDVKFDWKKRQLLGKAVLTVSPYFFSQNEIVFDAKNFDIHKVELLAKKNIPLRFEYDTLQLKIFLDKTYQKGENLKIQIDYTAKPDQRQAGGSAAITSDKGLYFINADGKEKNKPRQIWTQGETEANSFWFPTFDAPNVKTSQDIYITVEKDLKTLSNGKLLSSKNNTDGTRTDHWKQEKAHAPYLFMMAIGDYAVVKDKWKNLEVNYYVEPEYAPHAKAIFGNTPEMMDFFSNVFAYPFPWDKYAQVVVRDYVSGAMENTSASIFMEQLQVDKRYLLDENWDKIIAHELVHQWFGDLVTCESWANLPLNESFANYGEYLWLEKKYGQDEALMALREELNSYLKESQDKREPLIRYHYNDKEDMFDSHSYAKGCLVLNMLRQQAGDAAFFAALQLYLKKNEYKTGEIHQLRLAFEEVTGQDWNWFFNQWFLSAGHPEILVTDSFSVENKTLYVKINQNQNEKYTPIYKIPTYIDVYVNGKAQRKSIVLAEKEQVFSFELSQAPQSIVFDPENSLLAQITHFKSPDALMHQIQFSENVLSKIDGIKELKERMTEVDTDFANLLINLFEHKSRFVRQAAVEAFKEYRSEKLTEIAQKLEKKALKDESSLVRASAVATLASLGKYENVFLESMKDSSYSVLITSIYAYHNTGGGEKVIPLLQAHENIKNVSVIATLAEFFVYYKVPKKLDWFVQKIQSLNGYEQNYLINYLGNYLLSQDLETQNMGAVFFEKLAATSSNYQTRISCYQGLAILENVEGISDKLKKIRENETDERAKSTFELFGN